MSPNSLHDKALSFAVRIVNLYKYLTQDKSEFVMSKQILRSGSSIGANVSESIAAESSADFIHKLCIANKEAHETLYWLELLRRTNYLSHEQYDSLHQDCKELSRILTSSVLTLKRKEINS